MAEDPSEYFDAIRAARARHPDVTIIAGMEWNQAPGNGKAGAEV